MAQTTSTSSNFGNFPQEWVRKKLLDKGDRQIGYSQSAELIPFPEGNNKTVRFGRYDAMPLALEALTEGSNPTPDAITISEVTAALSQYGKAGKLTDVHDISVMHPTWQQIGEELKLGLRDSREHQLINVLNAETSVTYAQGRTARSSLLSTDYMRTVDIRKAVSALKNPDAKGRAAMKFGKLYGGQLHEKMVMDLMDDSVWSAQAIRNMQGVAELKEGTVGIWAGVEWGENNFSPEFQNAGDPTIVDGTAVVIGDVYSGAPTTLVGLEFTADNAAGSLTASTAYDWGITAVDIYRGFEEFLSGTIDHSTGAGETQMLIDMPDDTGYKYHVYAGTDGGTLYRAASFQDADAVVTVTEIPTSGVTMPVAPAEGVKTFTGHVFGKSAFQRVTLQLEDVIIVDTPDSGNILGLFKTIGYKYMDASVVTNSLWIRRIESSSAYV